MSVICPIVSVTDNGNLHNYKTSKIIRPRWACNMRTMSRIIKDEQGKRKSLLINLKNSTLHVRVPQINILNIIFP